MNQVRGDEKYACATSVLGFYIETEKAKTAADRLKRTEEMQTFWLNPLKELYEKMGRACIGPNWRKVGDCLAEVQKNNHHQRWEESDRLFVSKSWLEQAQVELTGALTDGRVRQVRPFEEVRG